MGRHEILEFPGHSGAQVHCVLWFDLNGCAGLQRAALHPPKGVFSERFWLLVRRRSLIRPVPSLPLSNLFIAQIILERCKFFVSELCRAKAKEIVLEIS